MLQLYVWGEGTEISVICPESLACSWLLASSKKPYEIIPSNNTNISDINKLPVLIVDDEKYHGFQEISRYIDLYPGDKVISNRNLTPEQELLNLGLINVVQRKIEYINQYNLYINTRNYEKYTRKLFLKYLPFPMMYNQPLKYYKDAQEQIKRLGLNPNKVGFFSLSGLDVAQTEVFNDENDDDDEASSVALSALHEKLMLAKSREKELLKESKNSLKCLNLINEYLGYFMNKDSKYVFEGTSLSSSEVLLFAYISALTYSELPDPFIANYLKMKYPEYLLFVEENIAKLNSLVDKSRFRPPTVEETPSLTNEVKYRLGYIEY